MKRSESSVRVTSIGRSGCLGEDELPRSEEVDVGLYKRISTSDRVQYESNLQPAECFNPLMELSLPHY